jgi:hypothetical protein
MIELNASALPSTTPPATATNGIPLPEQSARQRNRSGRAQTWTEIGVEAVFAWLLIDGDPAREGVEKVIRSFLPFVPPGVLVAFDDLAPRFPGLIETLGCLLAPQRFSHAMTYWNTLVPRKGDC